MSTQPEHCQRPIRTFEEAQRFLDGRANLERIASGRRARLDLGPTRALCEAVGNPERSFRSVHIAGTVGKGSTAHFLAALLRRLGFRTGLYVSPHLERVTERISVDGREIREEGFVEALRTLAPFADSCGATYFDLLTVAGFFHFRSAGADWAVVEVGIGGAHDSTNALSPDLCLITNVGSDHADVLGPSVAGRAREKAGIAKSGVPLVSGVEDPEALAAIAEVCASRGAPLHRLPPDFQPPFTLPDAPPYQVRNLALAAFALEVLAARRGWKDPSPAFQGNPDEFRVPGRFEVFPGNPTIVLDGAHVPEAVEALVEALKKGDRSVFRKGPKIAVFGAASDKDIPGMLKALAPWTDNVFMAAASSPRALPPEKLVAHGLEAGLRAEGAASPSEALERARRFAEGGTVLVTGSLYLVGEVRTLLRRKGR